MTIREIDALGVLKKCSRCKEIRPIKEFGKLKRSPDGFRYECKVCAKKERSTPRALEHKRRYNAKMRRKNPIAMRCRYLIGRAVAKGYIKRPDESRNWHNKWEFHHPDYDRPYYGCWIPLEEHRALHRGELKVKRKCIDYEAQVRRGLELDWFTIIR